MTHEQRLSEIRRRSGLLRAKQKKRRKILAAVCPLVLCLVVGAVALRPREKAADPGVPEAAGGLVNEHKTESKYEYYGDAAPQATAPPAGWVESTDLKLGGYRWAWEQSAVIADQAIRPLEKEKLKPIPLSGLVTPRWDVAPDKVTVVCWAASDPATEIALEAAPDGSFTALAGDHIYEITATWPGGTARYYARIIG